MFLATWEKVLMLEVLPRETVYSLRRSTKGDVQQMFIPDEENLYD